MPNGKVLQFPEVPKAHETRFVRCDSPAEPIAFRLYHCAGFCGAVVTSADSLCLLCAQVAP